MCGVQQAVLEHSAAVLLVFSQLLLMHATIHCCARHVQAFQCIMYSNSNKNVTDCALLLAQHKHVSVWLQPQAKFERL